MLKVYGTVGRLLDGVKAFYVGASVFFKVKREACVCCQVKGQVDESVRIRDVISPFFLDFLRPPLSF